MAKDRDVFSNWLTRIAVIAFALVTAALLLPGYIKSWQTDPPVDAAFYVAQAFERHDRVFDQDGKFGRLPPDAEYGEVISFECAHSSEARREFGWRGAREAMFDCPAAFADTKGRSYFRVFRLIADDAPDAEPSPEGYRTLHIDVLQARELLERGDIM